MGYKVRKYSVLYNTVSDRSGVQSQGHTKRLGVQLGHGMTGVQMKRSDGETEIRLCFYWAFVLPT